MLHRRKEKYGDRLQSIFPGLLLLAHNPTHLTHYPLNTTKLGLMCPGTCIYTIYNRLAKAFTLHKQILIEDLHVMRVTTCYHSLPMLLFTLNEASFANRTRQVCKNTRRVQHIGSEETNIIVLSWMPIAVFPELFWSHPAPCRGISSTVPLPPRPTPPLLLVFPTSLAEYRERDFSRDFSFPSRPHRQALVFAA